MVQDENAKQEMLTRAQQLALCCAVVIEPFASVILDCADC